MAAVVLASCNLHERMVELHLFQFDCWFIPPSQPLDWVSYLSCNALLATSLGFFLLLNQNNRDLFRLGHACPARHGSALCENLCCMNGQRSLGSGLRRCMF